MAKKIYDIKPPKRSSKVDEDLKKFLNEGKVQVRKTHTVKKPQKEKIKAQRSWRAPIIIGSLVLISAVIIFLYFTLQRAEILIWPKVEAINFSKSITAQKDVSVIDAEESIIPAYYFEVTKENSQNFSATGNASNEGKSSGNITIYNKTDPVAPITLKAGTHFMSDSGKLFVSIQKVVIPAGKKSGGKVTPGSVQIKVQAVEGGASYNVPPSNFSVPGLKGTPYYYSIYAVSTVDMTGGYTGEIKKVTNDDIALAKDTLIEKTESEAIAELRNKIPQDYILLDDAITTDINQASTEIKAGTVVDSFAYICEISVRTLAIKRADLEQFIAVYVKENYEQDSVVLGDMVEMDCLVDRADISGGEIELSINFGAGIYQQIEESAIAFSILGKKESQIQETIAQTLGDRVEKSEINFSPFWVFSAPKNQKAINVELRFK